MKLLQNLREVLQFTKHRKPTKIYCPRCSSSKIIMYSSFDLWLTPAKYICHECGYIGPIFLEIAKEEYS